MNHTALVLGAGASMPYGFPSSETLKKAIIKDSNSWIHKFRLGFYFEEAVGDMVNAFQGSPLPSIDAFLTARPEFKEQGLLCMAYQLAMCEKASIKKLTGIEDCDDNFYRTMFCQLVSGTTPFAELDFSSVKIVTFNYERSLKYYFVHALKSTFPDVDDVAAIEKLRTLEVCHVYGSLGQLEPPVDPHIGHRTLVYGEDLWTPPAFTLLQKAAKKLQLVPEGRNEAPNVQRAQEILRTAQAIAFIGFSFDRTNVERLGGASILSSRGGPDSAVYRPTFATCMNMTMQQQVAAASLCGIGDPSSLLAQAKRTGNPMNFLPITGERLLRETHILTLPARHILERHHLHAGDPVL